MLRPAASRTTTHIFEEITKPLSRDANGPQPTAFWFEKAARQVVAALRRAGQPVIRSSNAIVLHIQEIWYLAPGHEREVWR